MGMTYKLIVWAESRYNETAPADIEHLRAQAERLAAELANLAKKMPDFSLHFTLVDSDGQLAD